MRLGKANLVLLLLTTTGNACARTDTRPERTAGNIEEIVVTAHPGGMAAGGFGRGLRHRDPTLNYQS